MAANAERGPWLVLGVAVIAVVITTVFVVIAVAFSGVRPTVIAGGGGDVATPQEPVPPPPLPKVLDLDQPRTEGSAGSGIPVATNPAPPDLAAAELFAAKSPAVVRIEVRGRLGAPAGLGSGFFVTDDGTIVTNNHVVRGATSITVRFAEKQSPKSATIVATDDRADLAILKIDGTGYVHLDLAVAPPPIGTKVYAIGNPAGLTNTISDGLLSGIRTIPGRGEFLQTSAAISPGSSGGPLLTANGTAVGVTTMVLLGGQNLNFAVPASRVTALLASKIASTDPDAATSSGAPDPHTAQNPAGSAVPDTSGARPSGDVIQQAYNLINAGEYTRAVRLLESARGAYASDPKYYFVLGYAHGRAKHNQDAVNAYRHALGLDPTDAVCWYNLGVNLDALNSAEEAIAAYRSAIKCDSSYHKARLRLATNLESAHKESEAHAVLQEIIDAAPEAPEGKAAAATLARMRGH